MSVDDIVPIEREVVMAMVNDPLAIDLATQHMTEDLIFDKDCRNLFTVMRDLREAGLPTTKATIKSEILNRKAASGEIVQLIATAEYGGCSPWSVPALCRDIAEAAEFRRLIALRDKLTQNIDDAVPASELRNGIVTQAENGRKLSSADQPELISKVMRRLADMPNDELGARQVANGCRLQHREIMAGKLDATDRERIHALASKFDNVPLLLWEPTASTLERITATIRREAALGLKMVVVDYVSLIRHTDSKKAHWERLGDITRAMKSAAKRHNIPIVLLAQVGRDTEKREESRRPTLADLKSSGDLEQDSDASTIKYRIEGLLTSLITGSLDRDLTLWIAGRHPDLRDKLERVGLLERAEPVDKTITTLEAFLTSFLDGRADLKPSTMFPKVAARH